MVNRFKKIFKFGAQSFARNFWLAILTISILVLLLLSINILVILNFLTSEAGKQMQSKVDVSIYLKSDVLNEEAQSLRSYLMGLPSVSKAIYTSPDEVLEEFKEQNKDNEEILASLSFLEKNPFGGNIVVQTKDIDDYKIVLKQLNTPVYEKIIENKDFSDHERLVDSINQLTGFIKNIIIIVSIFFAFIAMVIVFNTIKIAIYTHRDEIKIMKLVGASGWFVRAPFIVEAIIYSLFAAIIAFVLVFPMISVFQPKVVEFFAGEAGDIFGYYREHLFALFSVQFLIVSLLSSLSACLAIGRHMRR